MPFVTLAFIAGTVDSMEVTQSVTAWRTGRATTLINKSTFSHGTVAAAAAAARKYVEDASDYESS